MLARASALLVLLMWGVAAAGQRSAEETISAFFGPTGIADKAGYYTGEMLAHSAQPTLGETLPPDTQIAIRALPTSGRRAAFGVTLARDASSQDWYAYLTQDQGQWKLEAVRTLALTGIPGTLLSELASKSPRTPDEEWTYKNLQLMFMSDDKLRTFVVSNREALTRIIDLWRAGREREANAAARALHLQSIEGGERTIALMIGGVLDNTVGIVFVPKSSGPPEIDPNSYIYVERAASEWYVFKTT